MKGDRDMKKAVYENANIELIKVSAEDILCSSPNSGNPFYGEDENLKPHNR